METMHFSGASRRLALCVAPAVLALAAAGCNLYFGSEEEWKEQERQECLDELHTQTGGAIPVDSFPVSLGPTVKADEPPPAISGGTLAISPDQTVAVASDPDRDQVYIVSLETMSLVATIPMLPQDEPGRIAFDDAGRVHVALRRGQNVVTIDLATGLVLGRNRVCASPRGIDFDELTGLLYVACHNGKLVTMDPGTGQTIAQVHLDSDLRDVVVTPDHVYVSRFRTADLLVLNRDLELLETMRPPGLDTVTFDFEREGDIPVHFEPSVAWRTVERPGGGVVMVHQRGKDDELKPSQGGYGGDFCLGGVVHAAVTPMQYGEPTNVSTALGFMVLPVDMTLIDNGQNAVVISAGNSSGEEMFAPAVLDVPVETIHQDFDCFFGGEWGLWDGQPIAAASMNDGAVIIQLREPSQLRIFAAGDHLGEPVTIQLGTDSVKDTGHALFHMNTGAGVSCASCHPEGGDDGRVWSFKCIGPRRTQSVNIGILGTEPLHWDGDMNDFSTLMNEVFVGRMGGGQPTAQQATFMAEWLDTLRPPPRADPEDLVAVERGRALFNDATVGCATCHAGAKFTNNQSYDVGTDGTFQVPSLVGIASRSPFIHTGCAPTLRDRFTNPACGGGDKHGVVSGLSSTQIDDLVQYLETL